MHSERLGYLTEFICHIFNLQLNTIYIIHNLHTVQK